MILRLILPTILWLFTFHTVFGKTQDAKLEITQLTGDFSFTPPTALTKRNKIPANGMYLITDEGAVLFDTPWDTVFRIGNYTFETFYPGEGHTADNIMIWFSAEKILYGAYLIKGVQV